VEFLATKVVDPRLLDIPCLGFQLVPVRNSLSVGTHRELHEQGISRRGHG